MKNVILLFFVFSYQPLIGQRYLSFDYPALDSIKAGVYGTSLDFSGSTQDLLYDFYAPKADVQSKRPLILYLHGGGFNSGSRSLLSIQLFCKLMAMKGYAVATIDYRLTPNFDIYNSNTDRKAMTDAMHDAKQAIRYFKAHATDFQLDTNKFFIGGESAGAVATLMATYLDKQSEMWPYPKANPYDPVGSSSNSSYGNEVNAAMCLCGLLLDTNSIESANNPPLLWMHGSSDPLIPISFAFNIVARAVHLGLPIHTKVFPGATHCPWHYGNPHWDKYLDSTIQEVTAFLYPKASASALGIDESRPERLSAIVYPQPCTNVLQVRLNKPFATALVSLLSTTGQTVCTGRFGDNALLELDVAKLDAGLYLLKMEWGNQLLLKRIVVAAR